MKNPMGLNNFDRLEAAGLVAGADDSASIKAKTEARVLELGDLITKVKKVEAYLASLYVLPKPRQLKRLAAAAQGLKTLHAQKLPTGTKKHIEACINEVTSLREGVYASNTKMDKQTLALTASIKARRELTAMVESAQHRLEKVMADSSSELDMEEFYKKAAEIIKKNNTESTKVQGIKDKPFLLARVPVVPTDGSLSTEKLPRLGFKSESISGYPVIHNQLVLGINPKMMAAHDGGEGEKFAGMQKKLKDSGVTIEELKKALGKVKDVMGDIAKLDPEKADKKYKEQKEKELEKLQDSARALIEKSGIDPTEFIALQQKLRRGHSALIPAVREEADRIRRMLEKKKGVKLRFVSESPSATKSVGGIWFWLMPDKELDMLAKAAFGNRVNIKQWGLAFS